ncbi:MAG: aspartate-semialdehyde dehydrogenase [Anaerolineales bacterium]|nr:aspartate-semialdehyde dehydrogenase [Anaerolineales bacterium]
MSKIPVAILGATGAVGQRFIQLLAGHPWFQVVAVAASDKSAGQRYYDAANWVISGDSPPDVGEMIVQTLEPTLPAQLVFSALPSEIAREVEPAFAKSGYIVCSNASAYRNDSDVPLLIPEVNADHVGILARQQAVRGWSGLIVTSPNCTVTGVALPLKPLDSAFGLRKVFMTSMQAISGAGYPGVASLDILGNVVPFINGEEDKVENELQILLGRMQDGARVQANLVVSAHTNRVPVLDGHTICMSLGFDRPPTVEQAIAEMAAFQGSGVVRDLPSAPKHPLVVRREPDRPQPRRDREAEGGMAVSVGRVRECPLLDLRLVSVSHNTLRGAASGSILNAELLVAEGYLERDVA